MTARFGGARNSTGWRRADGPVHPRDVSPDRGLRHTAATHLLRSRVDLNTIRAWLGHVRLDTTTVYAEIDLQRKAKAITLFDSDEPAPDQSYRDDEGLMAFLRSL